MFLRRLHLLIAIFVFTAAIAPTSAQDRVPEPGQPADPIKLTTPQLGSEAQASLESDKLDKLITQRLAGIYAEVEGLGKVSVSTQSGVVTLRGEVANGRAAGDAIALAERVDGVILVRDSIERLRDLENNLTPAIEGLSDGVDSLVSGLPLVGIAFIVFILIALIGHILAKWKTLWRRIMPNVFLAELVAQAVRIIAIVAGLVVALNLVGATALMGTILGGAGVIGIAIGFAVRDTLENYVSSIMLSLHQPFRADDHVVIGDYEGVVVRLTSRATILMTMDGNHLRIPNADVFKGVILNYTRNPKRRFDFTLGIDAADDPASGMETGLTALRELAFLANDQEPFAAIEEVGDSSIILRFYAWVDQTSADFLKARSMAIRAAKDALESNGFTLPEPINRLRFDQFPSKEASADPSRKAQANPDSTEESHKLIRPVMPDVSRNVLSDVEPDHAITKTIAQERQRDDREDLLDEARPVE